MTALLPYIADVLGAECEKAGAGGTRRVLSGDLTVLLPWEVARAVELPEEVLAIAPAGSALVLDFRRRR